MQSDPLRIIHGDALSSLRTLESESVQCVVTSPPYWGLRDYGVDKIVWDALDGCDHQWGDSITVNATNHTDKRRWNHTRNGRDEEQPPEKRVAWLRTVVDQGNFCETCGAWRGSLGLEPTPEMYAEHVAQVFRELKRVLRDDGTLWLNLGDSYAGGGNNHGNGKPLHPKQASNRGATGQVPPNPIPAGLKSKDLVGIPWMVAFALRADGWYLRSDIIWSKPNPMPESVTDRPTKAHEYIFLLSKSQKYYYDAEAIKEPYTESSLNRYQYSAISKTGKTSGPEYVIKSNESLNSKGVTRSTAALKSHEHKVYPTGRNRRTVWTVTTQGFPDAHFATFPPELITPCILAGAPLGGVVLDPFAGSGTTGKVAIELGRRAVLVEPKAEYVEMIKRRCQTTIGLPL